MAQQLPRPRGPLGEWLEARLLERSRSAHPTPTGNGAIRSEDTQLCLHMIYELSYRGYAGVDDSMERDPQVLDLTRHLEDSMERELRCAIGPLPEDPVETLTALSEDDEGPSLSSYLCELAEPDPLREFVVHRSAYQLKEADPHSWGLPRLTGRAKSALVEIQSDEYGRGVPGRSHAELFEQTMRSLDLDPTYGRYIDLLPASTLATGNLISLFGRQRRLLPALVGHLALFEMTSTGPMQRYSDALAAVGVDEPGREFFDVHVLADAHHEVLALTDLVGGLLGTHPAAGPEICFGALALNHVEGRFSSHLLEAFRAGRSSLLETCHPSSAATIRDPVTDLIGVGALTAPW